MIRIWSHLERTIIWSSDYKIMVLSVQMIRLWFFQFFFNIILIIGIFSSGHMIMPPIPIEELLVGTEDGAFLRAIFREYSGNYWRWTDTIVLCCTVVPLLYASTNSFSRFYYLFIHPYYYMYVVSSTCSTSLTTVNRDSATSLGFKNQAFEGNAHKILS